MGAIADQLLAGEPAYKQVRKLLGNVTLAEAALLPDQIKSWDKKPPGEEGAFQIPNNPKLQAALEAFWRANPENATDGHPSHHWFHYTDVEVATARKYRDARVGTSEFDVVHMITFCAKVLDGTESPKNRFKITKAVALVLLAHYVGDIHQPLHVGAEYFTANGAADPDADPTAVEDQGGNTITVSLDRDDHGRRVHTKLHTFWDSNSVTTALRLLDDEMEAAGIDDNQEDVVAEFLAEHQPAQWHAPTGAVETWAEQWADEILPIAREAHERLTFSNITITGSKQKLAHCLAEEKQGTSDYAAWAGLVVRKEIHKGGWRLAGLIRAVLVPRTGRELVLSPVAPYDHACAWEGVMHVFLRSRADAS